MSAQHQATDKLIGQVLANRYEIQQKLGEGAMGAVYKARHVKVGRPFAVKILHPRLLVDEKVALRFEREAELAGRLRHPNVVGVVDVGEVDDTRYMVMDFAEGPDLAQLLVEAPMPAERIIHLVRQMLEGLYHAHERGLIHRDFKPENVIVERDTHGAEVPRIVDFGIAILRDAGDGVDGQGRLTTNGLVLGTPHYMAPEQAVADPIDHRIDLFAIGIVIYEMLSGRLPFDGSGAEVARANLLLDPPVIAQRVPYLEVDPLLEAFSRRLMAKKRDARPATAKAARELLDLIERDRRAASQALGVPMSDRAPAATQPVAPQALDAVYAIAGAPGEMHTRPLSQPAAGPSAMLPSAPVPPMPVSFVAPAALDEPRRPTSIRTPLSWEAESLTRRRRPWLIATGILGAAGIAAAVMFATTSESSAPSAERAVMAPVAPPLIAPPPVAPPPVAPPPVAPPPVAPAVVPTPASAPEPSDPAPSDPVPANLATTRAVALPATRVRPTRSDSKPRDRSSDVRALDGAAIHRTGKSRDPGAETRPVDVKPVDVQPVDAKPEGKSESRPEIRPDTRPDTRPETRPAEIKAADARPADARAGITPRAISDLYYSIPPLLKSLPEGESQDLSERLRLHDVQRLMIASQAQRDKAAIELTQIRNEALARKAKSGDRRR